MKLFNYIDVGLKIGDKLYHITTGKEVEVIAFNKRVIFPIIIRNGEGMADAITAEGLHSINDVNPTYTLHPFEVVQEQPSNGYSRDYVDNVLCLFAEDFII